MIIIEHLTDPVVVVVMVGVVVVVVVVVVVMVVMEVAVGNIENCPRLIT